MARSNRALTGYAEGSDLCANWWFGCRAYHFITGANRGRPKLGLSLLLVARRRADFARVNGRGLSRGSHVLAPMAAARDRGQPGRNSNDLRREWRTPPR